MAREILESHFAHSTAAAGQDRTGQRDRFTRMKRAQSETSGCHSSEVVGPKKAAAGKATASCSRRGGTESEWSEMHYGPVPEQAHWDLNTGTVNREGPRPCCNRRVWWVRPPRNDQGTLRPPHNHNAHHVHLSPQMLRRRRSLRTASPAASALRPKPRPLKKDGLCCRRRPRYPSSAEVLACLLPRLLHNISTTPAQQQRVRTTHIRPVACVMQCSSAPLFLTIPCTCGRHKQQESEQQLMDQVTGPPLCQQSLTLSTRTATIAADT